MAPKCTRSVVAADLDNSFIDTCFVSPHRLVSRGCQCGASAQTEAGAMTRTNHDVTFDGSARKLTTIVSAEVVDCVKRAMDVEDRDQLRVDLDLRVIAIRDGCRRRDGMPGHLYIIPVCKRAASDIML